MLARRIDHRIARDALVGVQLAHELEALVDERDELGVERRDARSSGLHGRIAALLAHGAAG